MSITYTRKSNESRRVTVAQLLEGLRQIDEEVDPENLYPLPKNHFELQHEHNMKMIDEAFEKYQIEQELKLIDEELANI